MELISEYFSWCEGGRKSSIDPWYRVSSSALEEEEEEAAIGIRANGKEWSIYIYIWGVFWHFSSSWRVIL